MFFFKHFFQAINDSLSIFSIDYEIIQQVVEDLLLLTTTQELPTTGILRKKFSFVQEFPNDLPCRGPHAESDLSLSMP